MAVWRIVVRRVVCRCRYGKNVFWANCTFNWGIVTNGGLTIGGQSNHHPGRAVRATPSVHVAPRWPGVAWVAVPQTIFCTPLIGGGGGGGRVRMI